MEYVYSGNCPNCNDIIKSTKGQNIGFDKSIKLYCNKCDITFDYSRYVDLNKVARI